MLSISDYRYQLPEEKIALFPLPNRDESKLLVYQDAKISHSTFRSITEFLPDNSFLFFNDTKVIPARIEFKKDTGAEIEIFLLSPIEPSPIVAQAMTATKNCSWSCAIGNLKRWKDSNLKKQLNGVELTVKLADREKGIVEFSWDSQHSFAEIVSLAGETPLPPYLKRKAEHSDKTRYQTIYSHYEGAVAAPTAGLHFTEAVFADLNAKNIHHEFLTLHVSAGTFQPVKVDDVSQHVMHHEQIIVTLKNIENLLKPNKFIIPVGTTSMRTLESIYWYGVKLLTDAGSDFRILQDDPYVENTSLPSTQEALEAVKKKMVNEKLEALGGSTSIFIKPGYDFKVCKGLITNFHQPGSTLMLLVAALVGDDWKKIYGEALQKNYRFLSFGDSSLLLPKA